MSLNIMFAVCWDAYVEVYVQAARGIAIMFET
jgi:hypothetical protein